MNRGLRIDLLRVHGFGHFAGFELELKPGLNLVYGPNEAGKSTLLAFIRGVLFGFEKRGRAETRYEPESGPFGGELCLNSEAGPLVVRRVADRRGKAAAMVLSPEGGELLPARLEEALAHVSRELFCEVFAFSLEELSTFEKLAEEDGVTRALFAAGLRGARRLPEVEKLLLKRAGDLFKVSGKNPELNQVLKHLEECRAQLDKLKDRPEQYFAERERLEALERKQVETSARRATVASELEKLEKLEAALEPLAELSRLKEELATLPELSTFPLGGETRLEELLQRVKEARAQQARAEAVLSTLQRELAQLSTETAVSLRAESLRQALESYTTRADALRALPGRRAALEARRREVEQSFGGLGLAVSLESMLSLELGAAARGALEALADQLSRAELERRESAVAQERARTERERIAASLERLQAERARLPGVRAAQLRQRQVAWGRSKLLRVERDHAAAQETELEQRLQALRAQLEPEPVEAPSPWPMLLVGLVAVGLGVGLGLHSGGGVGALALLGVGLLLLPLAMSYRRETRNHQRQREAQAERQRQREQELARVRSALDTLKGRRVGLEREWAAAVSEAGVEPRASPSELAGLEAELAEALRQTEHAEHLERECASRQVERERVAREERVASLALQQLEQKLKALESELSTLLAERGFPPTLSPQRALALWHDAAALRQRLVELETDERALREDEASCSRVISRLREEAQAAGLSEDSAEALATRISTALEEQKTRSAEARALRARKADAEADQVRLTSLRESEEQALAALLAQGGCTTEESFRQRAKQAERYGALTNRIRELIWRLESAAGATETGVREALASIGGERNLKEQLGARRMEKPALDELQNRLFLAIGGAEKQLSAWENDEQLAVLRMQEERLRAKAAQLAASYATDRLALELLSRARRRFEQEQQPRVIQLASEHFATLTHHRYRRVFIPAGGKRELRVSDGRKEWTPEQLSRGTREQLYLAFRLAVIQEFGETRGVLPLIVDDILVNFDRERAEGTLALLAEFSQRHQIIAFTCHPWLRERFEAKGAWVMELPASEARAERPGAPRAAI